MNKAKPKISFTNGPAGDVLQPASVAPKSRAHMKAAPLEAPSTKMPKAAGNAVSPKLKPAPLTEQPAPRSMFTPVLAVVSLLTVGLGVAAMMLWKDDSQQAAVLPERILVQAEGVSERATAESVTRAAVPDLTDLANENQADGSVAAKLAAAVHLAMYPAENSAEVLQKATVAANAGDLIAEEMQALRADILADEYEIDVVEQNGVARASLRFIGADEASNAAKAILLQAVNEGRINAPESMLTAAGAVDLDTLLFDLVQTELATDGTEEGAAAAHGMYRATFMASRIQSKKMDGKRYYTVGAGDSLAYISLQFYGKPDAFQRIVDANRTTLQSPEKIQIGQRLIIPS